MGYKQQRMKNMAKSSVVVVWTLLALTNYGYAGTAYNSDLPAINVFVEDVIPHLVRPGDNITILLRVSNIGGKTTRIKGIKVELPEGMKIIGTYNNIDTNSSELCESCSRLIKYYIHVSSDLPTAKYPIKFRVYYEDLVICYPYYLDVKGIPHLVLTSPQSIILYPGGRGKYDLILKNVGTGNASKINIFIDSNNFYLQGSNNIYLSSLPLHSEKVIPLQLYSSKNVLPNNYYLSLKVEYEDDTHTQYSKTFKVAVNVISNVTMDISSISLNPNPPIINKEGQLTVRVENLGEGKAKNVSVEIEGDKEIFSYTNSYLGEIDEGEDSSAIFSYYMAMPKVYHLQINVHYTDDLGHHTIVFPYSFKVNYSKSNITYLIGGILILLGAGAYYFFRGRKNKKKNKNIA